MNPRDLLFALGLVLATGVIALVILLLGWAL
jgi:hypothetical protein